MIKRLSHIDSLFFAFFLKKITFLILAKKFHVKDTIINYKPKVVFKNYFLFCVYSILPTYRIKRTILVFLLLI
jgi:hypothetical protein